MVTVYEFDTAARTGEIKGKEGVDSGASPGLQLGDWDKKLCPHTVSDYTIVGTKVEGPEDDKLYRHECTVCSQVIFTWE
jgi:hypothetical protein